MHTKRLNFTLFCLAAMIYGGHLMLFEMTPLTRVLVAGIPPFVVGVIMSRLNLI